MSLSKAQADADLAAIDDVVAQVKQSRIYRVAGAIAMMWGVLQLVQYCARALAPSAFAWSWIAVDACGVAIDGADAVAGASRARRRGSG